MGSSPKPLPEFIWRLSKFEDLSGRGGLRVSGRWHTYPKCIVYCALEPHTAYLEMLRHFEDEMFFPDDLKMLKIKVPKRARIHEINADSLDERWSDDVIGYNICQPLGDEWLTSMRTSLLIVPSVTGPNRKNALINPSHPDITEFRVEEVISRPFDDVIRKPHPGSA